MLELIKKLLEKRRSEKMIAQAIASKKDFRCECPDCGTKGGFVLKPQKMIIQYSRCEYCSVIKGFVIKNKKALVREN